MVRKLTLCFLLFSVAVAVPSSANAWTIIAKIGSSSGSITGGYPTRTTVTSGTGYLTVPTGDTTVTVTPAAGYRVSMITLDGNSITAPSAGGEIPVPQAGKTSRNLIVYFAAATYSVTVSQTANGLVSVQQVSPTTGAISQTGLSSLRTGAVIKVAASPNMGYHVTSITVNGAAVWSGDSGTSQYYYHTVSTSNATVSATFSLVPVARASLAASTTNAVVDTPITLDASGSTTNDPALTYQFVLASGDPALATVTPAAPTTTPSATFRATAPGTYGVKVIVTSPRGATDTSAVTSITIVTQADHDSGVCASCHTNRDPAISAAFTQSIHYMSAGISCPSCHNPNNDLPHPYIKQPVDSCPQCHATITPQLVTEYYASPHNGRISCTGCHSDHSVRAQMSICQQCHSAAFTGNGIHAIFATLQPDICSKCHTTHNPRSGATGGHFNGYTSVTNPGYHASYVTPRTSCNYCHLTQADNSSFTSDDPSMLDKRTDWAGSGHGDVFRNSLRNRQGIDWKTMGQAGINYTNAVNARDCVRCHTPAGFLQYVDSAGINVAPVAGAGDPTSEPLSCNVCHTADFAFGDMANGMYTNVLDIGPAIVFYNFSSEKTKKILNRVVYNDIGESNVCMPCHTGKQVGSTIYKAGTALLDFTNVPFFDSHGMAAGAVLFKKAGYMNFKSGMDYVDPAPHQFGGSDQGACVVCHMDSSSFIFGFDQIHSFTPFVKNEAGAVVSISNPACFECHPGAGTALSADSLNTLKAQYQAALRALAAQLALKGMYYNPDVAPYFFKSAESTDAADAVTNWGNKNVMGAAFNLHLLTKEESAYVHNPRITRLLVFDSIDWLDNGVIDGNIAATMNALPDSTEYKAAAMLYLMPAGKRP